MPKSLKVRLLVNLLLSLCLAWAVTLGVGYILTQRTLNRQLDLRLEQIANSLSEVVISSETTLEMRKTAPLPEGLGKGVEFQIWRDDRIISYSVHAPKESLAQSEGYSQNEVDNKKWRVFSSKSSGSQVMVGEDLDLRKSLIRGMILGSLWPMIVALPIIGFFIWLAVTIGLKPLSTLAAAIKKRTPEQLSQIDIGKIPSEVSPVVQSLNGLLKLVDKAFEREKEFTDNAAHELRTPLAAIKTQAQVALRSTDEREKTECLLSINQGIDRVSRMVGQLLTMARIDPENFKIALKPIDLKSLVSRVIAKFVPRTLDKSIDIGLCAKSSVTVQGDSDLLELLVSNLIDNAIRYSPTNGAVDIRIYNADNHRILSIEDNGPGISEKDRERVFERFVRLGGSETDGSGIGLAIVKKIAALHHATIELETPREHSGLLVRVIL